MELGNAVFGNSRGTYPVPREEFEPEMFRLFAVLCPENGVYATDFENDIFSTFPYWWGDCTCGWESIDDGHSATYRLKHQPHCYQHEYKAIYNRTKPNHTLLEKYLKPVYEKYGWPTNGEDWWHGCAVKCTCDYGQRLEAIYERYAEEFGHMGCKPDCNLVKPNFLYKPTGVSISWYKYALRDSYMNINISVKQFAQMINHCINSLQR